MRQHPGQELCFATTPDEILNERVRIVRAQPQHVLKQLKTALEMLTIASSSTKEDTMKVRFGRNVVVTSSASLEQVASSLEIDYRNQPANLLTGLDLTRHLVGFFRRPKRRCGHDLLW